MFLGATFRRTQWPPCPAAAAAAGDSVSLSRTRPAVAVGGTLSSQPLKETTQRSCDQTCTLFKGFSGGTAVKITLVSRDAETQGH